MVAYNRHEGHLQEADELQLKHTHHQHSVESSSTIWSPAEARDLLVLNGELVIIRDLLSESNVSFRVDDYLLPHAEVDNLSIAVWLKQNKTAPI